MEKFMCNTENMLFKIKVLEDNRDKKGFVPVTWNFLDVEEIKLLLMSNYILKLIILNGAGEIEFEQFVELTDKIAWVFFTSPGLHKIYAVIMKKYDKDSLRINFTHSESGHIIKSPMYRRVGYNHYNAFINNDWNYCTINVPDDIFVSQPSESERLWVEWLFTKPANNTCSFNKRRIFAYSVQPSLFVMNYLFRLFIHFLAFMFGWIGFNWRLLKHPLTTTIRDEPNLMLKDSSKNFLTLKYSNVKHKQSLFILQIFLYFLPICILLCLISFICDRNDLILKLLTIFGSVLTMSISFYCVELFITIVNSISDKIIDKRIKNHIENENNEVNHDAVELCQEIQTLSDVKLSVRIVNWMFRMKNKSCRLFIS